MCILSFVPCALWLMRAMSLLVTSSDGGPVGEVRGVAVDDLGRGMGSVWI